jgi:hypothetical protein
MSQDHAATTDDVKDGKESRNEKDPRKNVEIRGFDETVMMLGRGRKPIARRPVVADTDQMLGGEVKKGRDD